MTCGWQRLVAHPPPRQLCPQAPQLFASLVVSMHELPHAVRPDGQPHTPPVQTPFGYAVHPVPSLAVGFVQTPVPAVHTPATWQLSLAVQAAEPQHTPLTQCPVPHCEPAVQVCPCGAVAEQAPLTQ
jgi:hypothetical protein